MNTEQDTLHNLPSGEELDGLLAIAAYGWKPLDPPETTPDMERIGLAYRWIDADGTRRTTGPRPSRDLPQAFGLMETMLANGYKFIIEAAPGKPYIVHVMHFGIEEPMRAVMATASSLARAIALASFRVLRLNQNDNNQKTTNP